MFLRKMIPVVMPLLPLVPPAAAVIEERVSSRGTSRDNIDV